MQGGVELPGMAFFTGDSTLSDMVLFLLWFAHIQQVDDAVIASSRFESGMSNFSLLVL